MRDTRVGLLSSYQEVQALMQPMLSVQAGKVPHLVNPCAMPWRSPPLWPCRGSLKPPQPTA
jgi:hypothetical protein